MNTPRKILVTTDFSPSAERAAGYAVRLAERLGAEVMLFHAFAFPYDWYYWDIPRLDELRCAVEQSAAEKLQALADRLAKSGVTVHTRLDVQSGVVEGILHAAHTECPDLIVVGTTGWTGDRPNLGSVAEQVVYRSGFPVLLVHRQAEVRTGRLRVLVPVDHSAAAAAALQTGLALAAATGGHVDALHVVPDPPFRAAYLGDEPVDAHDAPEHAQRIRAVERLINAQAAGREVADVYLAEGGVVDETARHAALEASDLVVMGISSCDRAHKVQQLALTAPCPVLAVPALAALGVDLDETTGRAAARRGGALPRDPIATAVGASLAS